MDSDSNAQDQNQNNQSNQGQSQQQNPADDISMSDYIEKDILELMGAKDMSDEEKGEIYRQMLETIKNRVLARVLDSLTEDQYETLKTLLSENDEEKFAQFALDTGIDLPQLYSEEALLYKIEMVNLIKMSQNQKKED